MSRITTAFKSWSLKQSGHSIGMVDAFEAGAEWKERRSAMDDSLKEMQSNSDKMWGERLAELINDDEKYARSKKVSKAYREWMQKQGVCSVRTEGVFEAGANWQKEQAKHLYKLCRIACSAMDTEIKKKTQCDEEEPEKSLKFFKDRNVDKSFREWLEIKKDSKLGEIHHFEIAHNAGVAWQLKRTMEADIRRVNAEVNKTISIPEDTTAYNDWIDEAKEAVTDELIEKELRNWFDPLAYDGIPYNKRKAALKAGFMARDRITKSNRKEKKPYSHIDHIKQMMEKQKEMLDIISKNLPNTSTCKTMSKCAAIEFDDLSEKIKDILAMVR